MDNNRLFNIDAMRGFLILLVVMEHSSTHVFKTFDGLDSVNTYFVYIIQFLMPAFFFICGYVLYKPDVQWHYKTAINLLRKKINSQILSPCLFFFLYLFVSKISLSEGLFEYHKEGYWYTFTLFGFYVLFSLVHIVFEHLKWKDCTKDVVLIAFSIFIFYLAHVICSFESIKDYTSLLGVFHWRYFFFFVFGYLMRKNSYKFNNISSRLCGISIIVYVLLNIFYNEIDESHWTLAILNLLILGTTGTYLVYKFFSLYQDSLFRSKLGRALGYIGQRTLCIYYVNFLLLPIEFQHCTKFLVTYSMPLIELILSFILASINIALCIIIYNIVFLCPPLGRFLFGSRPKQGNFAIIS